MYPVHCVGLGHSVSPSFLSLCYDKQGCQPQTSSLTFHSTHVNSRLNDPEVNFCITLNSSCQLWCGSAAESWLMLCESHWASSSISVVGKKHYKVGCLFICLTSFSWGLPVPIFPPCISSLKLFPYRIVGVKLSLRST